MPHALFILSTDDLGNLSGIPQTSPRIVGGQSAQNMQVKRPDPQQDLNFAFKGRAGRRPTRKATQAKNSLHKQFARTVSGGFHAYFTGERVHNLYKQFRTCWRKLCCCLGVFLGWVSTVARIKANLDRTKQVSACAQGFPGSRSRLRRAQSLLGWPWATVT